MKDGPECKVERIRMRRQMREEFLWRQAYGVGPLVVETRAISSFSSSLNMHGVHIASARSNRLCKTSYKA